MRKIYFISKFKTSLLIIIATGLIGLGIFIYLQIPDNSQLKSIKGMLLKKECLEISSPHHTQYALGIQLLGHSDKVAVVRNSSKGCEELSNKLKGLQIITISYKKNSSNATTNGYNLNVYSLKAGNEQIISLEKTNDRYNLLALSCAGIGLIIFFLIKPDMIFSKDSKPS